MASSSPPPPGGHVDVDEDPAARSQAGESGREGLGGRLRPAPPPVAHAPLLLGLDTEGGEHPQGPEHADDESLTGRLWGCVCGWRGTVRDVSTRPFHPRVGDGGRLRRQRLARSDRDARTELEAHLARATRPAALPAPPVPAVPGTPTPESVRPSPMVGTITEPGRDRPRGSRRRLTLPRTPATSDPAPTPATAGPTPAGERTPAASITEEAQDPTAGATAGADSGGVTYLSAAGEGPRWAASLASSEADDAVPGARDEALAAAAERARAARDELHAAAAALNTLVARAREHGASWRSIARATGVPHREAATRWGDRTDGPSLGGEGEPRR